MLYGGHWWDVLDTEPSSDDPVWLNQVHVRRRVDSVRQPSTPGIDSLLPQKDRPILTSVLDMR